MQTVWVIVAGLSIGWIVGLSNSPALSGIVGPFAAVVVIVLSAISGLDKGDGKIPKIASFGPVSVFLLFLSLSLTAGVYVRSSAYLVDIERVSLQAALEHGRGGAFSSNSISDTCDWLALNQKTLSVSKVRLATELPLSDSKKISEMLVSGISKREVLSSICGIYLD